ncbi:hypothetical protein [Frankia casuarinae]|nr:hypothetical protein [Frankia casuarinae]
MAVCVIALVVRRPLLRLLPRLSNLKYKDLELAFRQELSEIDEQAQAARPDTSPEVGDEISDLVTEVNAVAAVSPAAAIPLAWTAVEREIVAALERTNVQSGRRRSPLGSVQLLQEAGAINREAADAIKGLGRLRNEIVHAPQLVQLTTASAQEYARLAAEMIGVLQQIPPLPRSETSAGP